MLHSLMSLLKKGNCPKQLFWTIAFFYTKLNWISKILMSQDYCSQSSQSVSQSVTVGLS